MRREIGRRQGYLLLIKETEAMQSGRDGRPRVVETNMESKFKEGSELFFS